MLHSTCGSESIKEISAIEAIAQGRVWMGEDALELGSSMSSAGQKSIRHAAQLANLKKGFDVIEYPHLGTLSMP